MVNNNSLSRNMRRDESNTNSPFYAPGFVAWATCWLTSSPGRKVSCRRHPSSLTGPRGAPRDTSAGFGHLSWLLAPANYAGLLCSYKPHLQSDKFPAELGTHFPYCREEINSSLRGMAAFNLHGLDSIPKFKLGKMLISAKHFLSKSSFINRIW